MEKYKIYIKGNYFLIEKVTNREIQYGHRKEVLVDKNNLQKPIYRIFNVKDWRQREPLHISQILKEDGIPYTQEEWEVFYTTNTGNFSLGSVNLDPHILDALNNANSPSISNPFATLNDVLTRIVYGSNNPNIIPPSGTFKAGDNYVQTSTGDSTGTVISIWIYDGTQWVPEGSSPILVTCNNREIWTNATTDTVSVVIYTDGSAAVYDENSVVTNYSTGYNTVLTNSGFSLTRTLNCYDSLCLELNQVQYYDNNGSYNFVPTNGGISQTYTQLKALGAAECGSNVCPQIYSADDVINPNPINTTTGLPTNNPICLNTTSVWVNSSGIVQFTWDIGNQIWVVKPPVASINDQSSSNYVDIGNMRMAWGSSPIGNPSGTVTFPAPFAATPNITFSDGLHSSAARYYNILTKSSTGFTARCYYENNAQTSGTISYIAIGLKP